jgi:hypothetical protein
MRWRMSRSNTNVDVDTGVADLSSPRSVFELTELGGRSPHPSQSTWNMIFEHPGLFAGPVHEDSVGVIKAGVEPTQRPIHYALLIHSVFEALKVAEEARDFVGYKIELFQLSLEECSCFFLDELAGRDELDSKSMRHELDLGIFFRELVGNPGPIVIFESRFPSAIIVDGVIDSAARK